MAIPDPARTIASPDRAAPCASSKFFPSPPSTMKRRTRWPDVTHSGCRGGGTKSSPSDLPRSFPPPPLPPPPPDVIMSFSRFPAWPALLGSSSKFGSSPRGRVSSLLLMFVFGFRGFTRPSPLVAVLTWLFSPMALIVAMRNSFAPLHFGPSQPGSERFLRFFSPRNRLFRKSRYFQKSPPGRWGGCFFEEVTDGGY